MTVVLVHGAWHGAWCWEPVIQRLNAQGVAVVALDLPGHGASTAPFTDLHGDADFVRTVLDGIDDDVVLVGHSYGGAVITDCGAHPRVRSLVYVAAFAIDSDETVIDATRLAPPDPNPTGPSIADFMQFRDDGTSTMAPESIGAAFYNTCDAATQAWAAARVGPQPMVNFTQHPRACAWRTRPAHYVVCQQDLGVAPALQRVFAQRCSASTTFDCDHSPFASEPEALTDLLIAIHTP